MRKNASVKRQSRNRVLGDRLWDDQGREWSCSLGAWASRAVVNEVLPRSQKVLLHGTDREMTWMSAEQARAWWRKAEPAFEVPGSGDVSVPDPAGLTYAAKVWSHGTERLLSFQIFC